MENITNKFEVGESYFINYGNSGSVSVECVTRTQKTVTFEYNDGEQIKKKIKTSTTNLKDYYEFVVINNIKVTA